MDKQRASQGPDGSYDLNDSHVFVYEALSKELYVGNVYLRVYNDQPDFEISEPETFCVALIDFISYLVHNQCAPDSDVQNKPKLSDSSPESSKHPGDASGGSANEEHPDDSLAASDGQSSDKEECKLIKKLKFALTSLQVCCLFWGCLVTPHSIYITFFLFKFAELADIKSQFGINILYKRQAVTSF